MTLSDFPKAPQLFWWNSSWVNRNQVTQHIRCQPWPRPFALPSTLKTMNNKRSILRLTLLVLVCLQVSIFKSNAQTITNASFETPVIGAINVSTNYKVAPAWSSTESWTYSGTAGIGVNGCKYNPSNNYYTGDFTSYGKQYAFLDASSGTASISASFTVTAAQSGNQLYTFYFSAMQGGLNAQPQTVSVKIYSTLLGYTYNVGTFTPLGTNNVAWGGYQTQPIQLVEGVNTITFSTPSSGGAVLLDAITLAQSTTQSNSIIVNGMVDASGNINFGGYGDYGYGSYAPGCQLSYADGTNGSSSIGQLAAGSASSFLWQDNGYNALNYYNTGTNIPNNKMWLNGSNSLTLYKINGAVGMVLNPNAGGGITFPDGTTLTTANSLNNSGSVVWTTSTGGGLVVQLPSFAVGTNATASGLNSTAIGSSSTASGTASVALGSSSTASGLNSVVFGGSDIASGTASVAMGSSSTASGSNSVAFGSFSTASGSNSVVFGSYDTASGVNSFALGTYSTASGANAVAIGTSNAVSGNSATAFGIGNQALGAAASAYGNFTKASAYVSVAYGQYNVGITSNTNQWITNDPLIEVGNGTNTNSRSDSLVIFKNGEMRIAGLIQSQSGFMTPPTGDLSMGTFTNGSNPTTLIQTNGLKYPNGQ